MIHESHRRFLRSRRRREIVRTARPVAAYKLPDAAPVRMARPAEVDGGDVVTQWGGLWFVLPARGERRLGYLRPDEWEWRRPEWQPGGRA